MKNKAAVLIPAIMACAVLLGACVGTNALGVLDESVPEEMLCHLEIRNSLAVILFNNRPVEWAPGPIDNKVTISLPPGEHKFGVKYYQSQKVVTVKDGIASTSYEEVAVLDIVETEFMPGRSYRMYRQNIWLIFFSFSIIKVKDVTPK
jgi:hypothetical protein